MGIVRGYPLWPHQQRQSTRPKWTEITIGGNPLARTNFKYEKRQKELAKQAKAEEKRLRKLEKRNPAESEEPTEAVESEASAEACTGKQET